MGELGRSSTAKFYGITSVDEARAYLAHPLLGARYLECVSTLQDLQTSDPSAVLGQIDAMKLRLSLTLFQTAKPSSLLGAASYRSYAGSENAATRARSRRRQTLASAALCSCDADFLPNPVIEVLSAFAGDVQYHRFVYNRPRSQLGQSRDGFSRSGNSRRAPHIAGCCQLQLK